MVDMFSLILGFALGAVSVIVGFLLPASRRTKRVPDAGDSAASQTLSPQSGESTPEVNPAATQRR